MSTTLLIRLSFEPQTVAAIMTFFLAMALHPNIMRKVQHDLDAVTERNRLPTFEDRERLPFVDAVCREVLRWQPVTPLGAPINGHPIGISVHLLPRSCPARNYGRRHLRWVPDTQRSVTFARAISVLTDARPTRRDCNRKFMVNLAVLLCRRSSFKFL